MVCVIAALMISFSCIKRSYPSRSIRERWVYARDLSNSGSEQGFSSDGNIKEDIVRTNTVNVWSEAVTLQSSECLWSDGLLQEGRTNGCCR